MTARPPGTAIRLAASSLAVVVVSVFLGALLWAALRSVEPPHARPSDSRRTYDTPPPTTSLTDLEVTLQYLSDIRDAEIAAAREQAAREALFAYLASIPPPPPPAPAPVEQPSPPVVSGACGGATNGADQFIQRESGGDPNVWNQSGSSAWGCYQILGSTWAGAGCDEFGQHGSASPAAQAACASRLPLSAWAL